MARDVTQLLQRWAGGDREALDELIPIVYDELRALAGQRLQHERAEHTLEPTSLVHEVYVRLTGLRDTSFENRAHFYGAVAETMRRVLVDHARRQRAEKRGSGARKLSLDAAPDIGIDAPVDVLQLHDALEDLARQAAEPARVVELRYFGGLSIEETATVTGVSPATVKRHWTFARAWLFRALERG